MGKGDASGQAKKKPKMPTTVFRADNANVVWGGAHVVVTQSSRQAWEWSSLDGDLQFTATGTDLTVSMFGAGNVITLTIDGGAPTTFTPAASWNNVSLFAGLSDTAHTVKLKQAVTNGSYIELANAFSLTGAAPALALPTNFSNNIYNVGGNVGITPDGTVSTSTQNGNPTAYTGFDYSVRFRATCTRIKLWMLDNVQKVSVAVDGVDINSGVAMNTPGTGRYDWVDVATGLDGAGEHEYTVCFVGTNAGTVALVMAVGGTMNQTAIVAYPTWAFYGDSIWRGLIAGTNDSSQASPHEIMLRKHWGNRQMGVGGSLVKGTGTNGESATRIATIPTTVTGIVNLYGFNDAEQNGGAETDVQFGTSYANMLTQQRTRIGAGKYIYCLGILPTTFSPAGTNRTAFNAQIVSAVAAQADAFTVYINTDGWIVPATDTVDLVHPTPAGYVKITNQFMNVTTGASHSGGGGRSHSRRKRNMVGRTVKIQFSSADASTAAAVSLYDDNDAAVTLASNERLIIDTIDANVAAAVTLLTLFSDDDADAAIDAGERIAAFGPNSGFFQGGEEGYVLPIGKTPKLKASGAGQVDVTGSGRIVSGTGGTVRPTWKQAEHA